MQVKKTRRGKQNQIADALKNDMLQGLIAPGERLPAFSDLEQRFKVSRLTLQLAIQRLQRDGFIRTEPRQGTFVSDQLPYMHSFAVVLPPQTMPNNRFWMNLSAAAEELQAHLGCKIEFFRDVDPQPGNPGFENLQYGIKHHLFAGAIFAESMVGYEDTAMIREKWAPLVCVNANAPETALRVQIDAEAFVDRACEALKARNRKRVAIITRPDHPLRDRYLGLLKGHGLQMEPYWVFPLARRHPECAANLTTLLFKLPPNERPDGLIIADDNLVESALGGIVQSGCRVAEDMDVVVHCNWPWPVPSTLPVLRLGYDISEVLEAGLRLINAARSGKTPEASVLIAPRFENEIVSQFVPDTSDSSSSFSTRKDTRPV